MKKAVVLAYKPTSKSARYLTEHLEGRMIVEREPIQPNECIINWGGGHFHSSGWQPEWLNKPSLIEQAVEKLVAFRLFKEHGVQRPFWTTEPNVVRRWLQEGCNVVVRQTSTGMMGRGISILNPGSTAIPSAEFYTKHVGHDDEYRVHVFKGLIINIGVKVAMRREANRLVRNADERNWDFQHVEHAPFPVCRAGMKAIEALGLDFGAADIGYKTSTNDTWVFEVNTAPGVGHNTITCYANAIRRYLRSI